MVDPSATSDKLKKRSWLQFSLRSLLLLVAVISGWLGLVYLPAKRADWASKDLERLGVQVHYDYQHVPGPSKHCYSHKVPKPGPAFLRAVLGDGLFQHADELMLSHTPLKSDNVKLIEQIPTISDIWFDGCGIGDENMVSFSKLSHLDFLLLRDNKITELGLKNIADLTNLETLDLTNNPVHDDGLASLENLTNLESLWLDGTDITDGGLMHLAHLKKLKFLSVDHTAVTSVGAERLLMPNTPSSKATTFSPQPSSNPVLIALASRSWVAGDESRSSGVSPPPANRASVYSFPRRSFRSRAGRSCSRLSRLMAVLPSK